jgi:hypothetical protein
MTQEEAQTFAANFPSQRDLVGFRLVSDSLSLVRLMEEAAKIDVASSSLASEWSREDCAPSLKPFLPELESRLKHYATTARKAL